MSRFWPDIAKLRGGALFLTALIALIVGGCASQNETQDGDLDGDASESDSDGDFLDGDTLPDGDSDAEEPFNCLISGCDSGYYCDDFDGKCKGCAEDIHCGNPNPVTGVVPVCRNGRCIEVVCGAIQTLDRPADGIDLGSNPQSAAMNPDGTIVVNNRVIFPLGVMAIHPDLLADARDAGANMVISSRGCCKNALDADYQLNTFLPETRKAQLYAAMLAQSPLSEYAENSQQLLMESIRDRSNQVPLLAWFAGDRASQSGQTTTAITVYEDIHSITDSKPVGFGEHWSFDPLAYSQVDGFFMVSMNPDSVAPGSELLRYKSKPYWARIETSEFDAADYLLAAIHALANGAGGLVFELESEDNKRLPEDWQALSQAIRFLKDRSELWLSERESSAVRMSSPTAEVAMTAVYYQNKTLFIFIANAALENRTVSLTLAPANLPFCLGIEGEDQALHITHKTEFDVTLAARELKIYQVSEALPPGDDVAGQ
jgi:hypothetical protein